MVYIVKNNIMEHYLSSFRDEKTSRAFALECVERITYYLCGKASEFVFMKERDIQTPLGIARGMYMNDRIELIPVLRAGLAMLPPFQKMFPNAHIGFISLSRKPDLSITYYYDSISKDLKNSTVFIMDPMLATGNTATKVLKIAQDRGAKRVVFISILSAQMGIQKILEQGDYPIITMRSDEGLDEHYYLYPGVGDSGDRLFGKI